MTKIEELREDYHLLELENESLSHELELEKKEKQDLQSKLDEILDMPRENLEEHLESLRSLRELRKKREENALETQRELFLQSKKK